MGALLAQQDKDFIEAVISTELLDNSIEWIKTHMEIDDVFDEKEVIKWAGNRRPEDIFTNDELANWATSNGFTESE